MTAAEAIAILACANLAVLRALLPGICLRWAVYDRDDGEVVLIADCFLELLAFARGVQRGKAAW